MSNGFPWVVPSLDLISLPRIQFRSVKYTAVTKTRKNFEQLLIPIQMVQDDYSIDVKNHFKNFWDVSTVYIFVQIVWYINYYAAGKWFNQYL